MPTPARIIAVMNQKGGVGKTTTTVNLGAALAELGRNVLLIDLDPQAHLSITYGVETTDETVTLYNVLLDERSILEAAVKLDDRIAVVPGSIDLAAAELELAGVEGRETVLKRRIESAQHDFDYVLIDCPPSLGVLTVNALVMASEVIIPMQPQFLALQGVGKLIETVEMVRAGLNPALKVSGIVLTMWDGQARLSNEVVADLQAFLEGARDQETSYTSARLFSTRIRRNIKLAEAPSFGKTVIRYEPSSNGAADYRSLAREVDAMTPRPARNKAAAAR